ncbi:MAG: type II toxin-antitoxin system RelE/ParE family toxin [Thermoplasmata archaeon]
MSYQVVFDPKAKEKLADFDKSVREQIFSRIRKLENDPEHFGKALTGIDLWVLRAGDYRVMFDLNKNENLVEILRIGHRRNIYDKI